MTDSRPCTCAPDERPYPCQHQYALGLCRKAKIRSLRNELDRCNARIEGLTKERDKWIDAHRQLMDPIIRAKMLEPSPPMICDANVPGLIAENDALRRDAERYRWLKENARRIDFAGLCWSQGCELDARIDAAIDQARKE